MSIVIFQLNFVGWSFWWIFMSIMTWKSDEGLGSEQAPEQNFLVNWVLRYNKVQICYNIKKKSQLHLTVIKCKKNKRFVHSLRPISHLNRYAKPLLVNWSFSLYSSCFFEKEENYLKAKRLTPFEQALHRVVDALIAWGCWSNGLVILADIFFSEHKGEMWIVPMLI